LQDGGSSAASRQGSKVALVKGKGTWKALTGTALRSPWKALGKHVMRSGLSSGNK